MAITPLIAKHLREVHTGDNWTYSNLKDAVADVTWQQATTRVHGLNTIAMLVYHINYYIDGVTKFLQGGTLDTKDEYSFSHPPIQSEEDWKNMLDKVWADAERFASLVEQLPDEVLLKTFNTEQYGNYYRNLHGIIEHFHYHLGQIVLIKKIIQQKEKALD